MNQRRNEALDAVLDEANKATKQIAEQHQYDLMVQEGVHLRPHIDMTDQILKMLATSGNGSGTAGSNEENSRRP